MKTPKSLQALQSFNGMVNYLKRFSPVLTELSEPLRRLQKQDTIWAWESEQQIAFKKIKTALITLPVLAYFDKDKNHIIQTDASKMGLLGAVLQQDTQPMVYASRVLTDTECRYSNIERITWCCLQTWKTSPLHISQTYYSRNRPSTSHNHLEKDNHNIMPKATETVPQTSTIWCTHWISSMQREHDSRCTIKGNTPQTRTPRL